MVEAHLLILMQQHVLSQALDKAMDGVSLVSIDVEERVKESEAQAEVPPRHKHQAREGAVNDVAVAGAGGLLVFRKVAGKERGGGGLRNA